jgi:hypothetical protein
VTWADARDVLATALEVRTRVAGTSAWRPWATLTANDTLPDGMDGVGRLRGGTSPIWVGNSDGVELRARGRGVRLPADLRLDLVDPGSDGSTGTSNPGSTSSNPSSTTSPNPSPTTSASTTTLTQGPSLTDRTAPVAAFVGMSSESGTTPPASPASASSASGPGQITPSTTAPGPPEASTTDPPSTSASTTTTGSSSASAPSPTTFSPPATPARPEGTPPPVVTRAGWRADESIRRVAPTYSSAARVVFVHHTTSSNGYDCSQSPSIIRSQYAYHTLSLGWNDIGYNFLVDRCGTVYEGRYGGIDRPVTGAQIYGFNTNSAGIAVIGTYTRTSAPTAVLASVARLAAWKLSLAGLSPTGTSTLVENASDSHGFVGGRSYTFPTISGHRDGYATECPGDAFYAQLPALRALAAAYGGPVGPVVTVTGAAAANGRYYTTGRATMTWSAPSAGADVAGYTVLVDGRVAATSAPHVRTATLTLSPGTHTVTVRATYRPSQTDGSDGTPGSPTTAPRSGTAPATTTAATTTAATTPTTAVPSALDSVPVTVVADVTRPVFASPPRVGLRHGTVNDTGVPVSLAWRATDNAYLARVTASSPARATFTAATKTWAATVVPGARTYALTATDGAGNTRTATVSGRTTLIAETAATSKGSWSRTLNTSHLGGSALSSRTKGAVISWSFTGTAVAWVATRTKASGQAVVYLDGVNAGTVDLASAYPSFRQSVWTRSGLTAKRHTVTVVVVATRTRPTVITDGIVYLSAK